MTYLALLISDKAIAVNSISYSMSLFEREGTFIETILLVLL